MTMDFGTVFGNAFREAFGAQAAFFALLAIGLNVQYGYTGLLNFGQIGFALVGAYGVGIAVVTFGWPLWGGVLLGLLAGVGLQNVARTFADLNPFTQPFTVFGTWTYLPSQLWSGLVSWGVVILCTGLVFLLMRSPWGRILKGIREDEDAVRSLGKNAFSYKMQSLILGGVIGSLAGVMLVLQTSTVNDVSFLPRQTFFAYAILIIGGAATTWGPVVGTMIFWFMFTFLSSLLRDLDMNGLLPEFLAGADKIGAFAFAAVGLTLMLLIIFRPQGILGDRRELLLDV
jgi:neutral amino acid transport system permease protein